YMRLTPYDKTLFLDADTFVCDDVSELFVLLERFDLAVAQDTYRIYSYDYAILKEHFHKIPVSSPVLNTGVIVYKRSSAIDCFFADWAATHERNRQLVRDAGGMYCGNQNA